MLFVLNEPAGELFLLCVSVTSPRAHFARKLLLGPRLVLFILEMPEPLSMTFPLFPPFAIKLP